MSRAYAITDVVPQAVPFKNDEELRLFLGLPETAEGRAILAKVTPEQRQQAVEIRVVISERQAGRVPRGVLACSRIQTYRRSR